MLHAISPVDGRYADKTRQLQPYFSEFALIQYRVRVEIVYFQALASIDILDIPDSVLQSLTDIWTMFTEADALKIKEIERKTNHDVKAVEYFLRNALTDRGLGEHIEFIHFGLTSQDINNTAIPLSLKEAATSVLLPEIQAIITDLKILATTWKDVPMLARTHGQPASPTLLGKEMMVFVERLEKQKVLFEAIPYAAKFGGATGNFNAHHVAYPNINWPQFSDTFCKSLGLERSQFTTQIEHYDMLAAHFQSLSRINTIFIDMCRDIWAYISMDYFRQLVVKDEVGSSAMPHKVNPIDFENAEGNLGIANALCGFLAEKLPISRLQRDLTDSTVLRNIGMPYAHSLIALQSIRKGLSKLILNDDQIARDLEVNWSVLAEPIQTILRRERYPDPYNALKTLTRGQSKLTRETLNYFIDNLDITNTVKEELRQLKPEIYTGVHPQY
ncbi:MAG: adenylosuccinate lyase [Saprospiraceae bacterium]|jgi:adenylosuccinate lyase|nr:adenylosuccinate lyase [Saprospiraceae bacterium]